MTQSNVNLILSADTAKFSAAIRRAEHEFSSRFKQMGNLSKAQSIQIQDNFNGISNGAERLSSAFKQSAKQLILIAGAATGIALLGKNMLHFADNTVKTVQIAPSIINFSQMIVSALPKIKEMISYLYGFKDAFVLLAKVIIVGKLVSFSVELISASKSFVVASVATLKFTDAMMLMGKAVRGIGFGLAILGIVEALSLLKQHLDLKKEIKGYIQFQQMLIDANQQFSETSRINIDAFKALSSAEQKSYYERLKAAQQFWQGKLALEARQDFQSSAAMFAAKENRLYLENLHEIEGLFNKRNELERVQTSLLTKIRGEETTKLKQAMSEQLKIFDKANNDLQALKEKRKSIAKEFQDLRTCDLPLRMRKTYLPRMSKIFHNPL